MADHHNHVQIIDTPVHQVTLLEDRARVRRQGTVELPAGMVRVRVEGVAPVLSDKTLVGEVVAEQPDPGARIADLRVTRELQIGYDEAHGERAARAAALQDELRELDLRVESLESERVITERHASGLDKLTAVTMAELSEDVSWGQEVGDDWRARLTQLRDSERALRLRLVDIAAEIEDLRRKRQRLDERIVRTQNPREREWAAIEADVVVATAGSYTLAFEYATPNACWRPYHTAKLQAPGTPGESNESGTPAESEAPDESNESGESGEPGDDSDTGWRVAFATDACVWQRTGEDWRDIQLILSTERASLGTEPPPLTSDILRVRRKSDAVVVETREQEIQTLGPTTEAPTVVAAEVPGIDDGGEALHLSAPRPSTVPSDGRPYRVRISSFDSRADVDLVAMPELTETVLTRSVLTNEGKGPILAGPVDLIRQSGLIGRTSVLFVAPGARFELGWGPEPDLRVKRETDVTEDKSRMLSSWVERVHEIEVRLSNLGAREHTVSVTERIPVSEIDKVKITTEVAETTGAKEPDDNGFLVWHVTLGPGEHERVQLRYKLERHEDVHGL